MAILSGVWEVVSITRTDEISPTEDGLVCFLVTVRKVRPGPPAQKSQFIMAKDKFDVLRWLKNNYTLDTPLAWTVP